MDRNIATDALDMKVSQREDLSDASWQPYTTTLPLQLAPSSGINTQTVYAQFRDSAEQTLCQGAIMADEILIDTLPPTGTATITANDSISVTLQLAASDQTEGSGVEYVAILPVTAGEPAIDPASLQEEAWQPYESAMTLFKPMSAEGGASTAQAGLGAASDLTYQVWFRDAVGNIAAPITITVPYVEPEPVDTTQNVYLPMIMN